MVLTSQKQVQALHPVRGNPLNPFLQMEEKKINKRGRPSKNNNKRTESINASLTLKEYNDLLEKAKKAKLKPSVLAQKFIVKGYIKSSFTDTEIEARRQLIGMANNLNQLLHLAHKFGIKSIQYEAEKQLNEMDMILEKFN